MFKHYCSYCLTGLETNWWTKWRIYSCQFVEEQKKLHTHWLKNCQLQVLRKMHYPQNCVFIQHDPKISDWAVNSSRKWFPGLAPGFNRKKSRFSSTPFKTRFFWLAVYYSQGVTSRWVYLRWPYKEITPLWHHRSKSKKNPVFLSSLSFWLTGISVHTPTWSVFTVNIHL